ncbi:MAG: hypothetical protein PSY12_04860 [bacterium]|nr:hypothetical protein [bacterium]
MAWLKRATIRLVRAQEALKREFLRDPDVILFDRSPDGRDVSPRQVVGSR